MSEEDDRRLDKTIRWSGVFVAILVIGFCSTPFVNDFLYRSERARLMDELRPMVGLSAREALARIERSRFLQGYEIYLGESSVEVQSPNVYGFIGTTARPTAGLMLAGDSVTAAKLIERGSAF